MASESLLTIRCKFINVFYQYRHVQISVSLIVLEIIRYVHIISKNLVLEDLYMCGSFAQPEMRYHRTVMANAFYLHLPETLL